MSWFRFGRGQQAHVAALDEGLRNIAETKAASEQRKLITAEVRRMTRMINQMVRDREACAGETPAPAKAEA